MMTLAQFRNLTPLQKRVAVGSGVELPTSCGRISSTRTAKDARALDGRQLPAVGWRVTWLTPLQLPPSPARLESWTA